jgi:hypothetical protein
MVAKKIAVVFVLVIAMALVVSLFVFPDFFSGLGIENRKGVFELGFSKNQLALLGADAGLTEQEKMEAIRKNFFVFEFGDLEKKLVVEQDKLQAKQGEFQSRSGAQLEGWLLLIPNIEKGKDYQYEIRIPNYEISEGQFTAGDIA